MDTRPSFISRLHAYVRAARTTRRDSLVKPGQAPTGLHKEYGRFPRVVLPAPEAFRMPLEKALRTRASTMEYLEGRPFSLAELGTLLGNALGMRDNTRRNYPSGGALYPVETYLVGSVIEGHPSGVFHYHPKAHALEYLWPTPPDFQMSDVLRSTNVPLSPVLALFTGVWRRSSIKYGDFSYSHGLIETGHMAQNLLLCATALGIEARPVSGCDDQTVHRLLDLDGVSEQVIYSVTLCPPRNRSEVEKKEAGGLFE